MTILSTLGMRATFVPHSQSRHRDDVFPHLNWIVVITHRGRDILTTDYSQGAAYAPAYRPTLVKDPQRDTAVEDECETGLVHRESSGNWHKTNISIPTPSLNDVLISLATDADALNYADFESWTANFGADPDSRKAEAIYQECLKIALKLRAAIGDEGLAELRSLENGS